MPLREKSLPAAIASLYLAMSNIKEMHQDDDPFYYNNNNQEMDQYSSFLYNNYNSSSQNPQTLQGVLGFDHPNYPSYMSSFTDCLNGSSLDYNTYSRAFDMSCNSRSSSKMDENMMKDGDGDGDHHHHHHQLPAGNNNIGCENPSTPNSSISSSSNEATVVASTTEDDNSHVKITKKEKHLSKDSQDVDQDKSTKGYV